MKDPQAPPIAEALRFLRNQRGLTQTAAGKLDGAPEFRTLSHWETRRKMPSLGKLLGYLTALRFDLCDLQRAMDRVSGQDGNLADLVGRIERLEKIVGVNGDD